MPPRDPSLPEGTDHIIDTNIDIGPDTGAPGLGGGGSTAGSGGAATGSSGSSTTGTSGGGTQSGGGSTSGGGGSAFKFDKTDGGNSNSKASGIMGQVKDQISNFTSQAGDKAKGLADDGKGRATDFLQTIAKIIADASGSVEERLGGQYAGFGNKASESIQSLASTLDERSVDDLLGDARAFFQRSPVLAIGVAAVVGFAVARVARATLTEYSGTSSTNDGNSAGGNAGGGGATGGTGGLNATSGAFGETGVGTAGNVGGSGASMGAGSTGGTGNAPTI